MDDGVPRAERGPEPEAAVELATLRVEENRQVRAGRAVKHGSGTSLRP